MPILLLLLTIVSTTIAGAEISFNFQRNLPPFEADDWWSAVWLRPGLLWSGLPFSMAVLSVLLTHEMGHYAMARARGIRATLPYFLPAPTPLGTLGAFIRILSPIYGKRDMFDIAVAGPLAGFVVAVPTVALGLAWSRQAPSIDAHPLFGMPLLMEWMAGYLFPHAGRGDLLLHPVAYGAWVGLFGTAMNLIPLGQLDGGKVLFAYTPRWHRVISYVGMGLLVALGVWVKFYAWILLAVLMWFAPPHPPLDEGEHLGWLRRMLTLVCILIFAACFLPQPVRWQ